MSLLIPNVQAAPLTWSIETVDAATAVGPFTSIALDSYDRPHISYFDDYWNDLKYARWTGSGWFIEPVDTVGFVGTWTSIALDSLDRPYISYYDWTNQNLKYARWTGTTWFTYVVDTMPFGESDNSLALDSNDNIHISYYDKSTGILKYYWQNETFYSIELVDSGNVGMWNSLAVDSDDRPHISYFDNTNADLKYAQWNGSAWSKTTVDSSPAAVGLYTSIALDSSDNPHISYYDETNHNLKYANRTGSTWLVETVDAAVDVGSWTSIALDSYDRPHISYFDDYWDDLKYARLDDQGWFIKNVDSVGEVGWYTSLALDSRDHPCVSYWDGGNSNLKYAQDPDEYFESVDYTTFDDNGDTFHDSIEMAINVDTTYNGSLGVYVYIYLVYPNGSSDLPAIVGWSITYLDPTLQIISITIAPGDPEGLYDVELHLFDESYNFEDYWFISDFYLYPPDMRELTIQVEGSGTTSPAPGSWWVTNGTELGVEAFPDSGWMLHHWVLDTVETDPFNPIFVIMDSNHVLTAVFVEIPPTQHQLTIEVEGSGTTSPAPGAHMYDEGSVVPVDAQPEAGWMLDHWLLDSVVFGPDDPFPVTMDDNHVLRAVFAETPSGEAFIESCGPAGGQNDLFDLGETLYVRGSNYSSSTTYDFYIVVDEEAWSDGMAIPVRVPDTAVTVSSNIDGDIPPTAVWGNPQTVGKYDVVVDVNGNGQYDAEIDALDNDDIEVTAGLIIIPEFPSFFVLSLFITVTLLAAIVRRKHSM